MVTVDDFNAINYSSNKQQICIILLAVGCLFLIPVHMFKGDLCNDPHESLVTAK